MTLFEELKARGLVAQTTDEAQVRRLIDEERITFYIGFDPTADSLHVGHFVAMVVMAHMQRHGHRPIALFGGGTGMIGDPSGKTDMRKMLTREEIAYNISRFQAQMARLIDFSDGGALMADNADWLMDLNYISFLRDIGVHFSVNRMLAAECYKQRLERGLSFFELNYMIMQSYDFLHLFRTYGCVMQLGGDDQWSNMISGVNLIRKAEGGEAFAMTCNLLLTSDGKKMGKTENGAVWLDPEKMPPYDFYQYWRNIDDADVIRTMKMLTFIPLEEIAAFEALEGSALNPVKERLAYELTAVIHGAAEADKARDAARAIFGAGAASEDMPTTYLSSAQLTDGRISLLDAMLLAALIPSKGEGRRLVQQGGVRVDDVQVSDPFTSLHVDALKRGVVIRKGKKVYHRLALAQEK